MTLKFTEAMIGKPFTWRTNLYGDIAVHVEKFSPNGAVANLTIDGGPDATPCQRYPELADGIGFAVEGGLFKRTPNPRRVRTRTEQEVVIAQGMQRKRARRTAADAEVTF